VVTFERDCAVSAVSRCDPGPACVSVLMDKLAVGRAVFEYRVVPSSFSFHHSHPSVLPVDSGNYMHHLFQHGQLYVVSIVFLCIVIRTVARFR
jgi:hypothetical protein